jgi:phosphoribosyl 1,2-cyclic phosphodiesterase
MRLCVLGSGSSGNATYIESGGKGVLVDAGLSCREIERRLAKIGVSLSSVRAVLVSHEHSDHVKGLQSVSRKYRTPIYCNRSTAGVVVQRGIEIKELVVFKTGTPFMLDGMTVNPFPVIHDAVDPVGFVVTGGGCRIGVATDLGSLSREAETALKGCVALVVESNHDVAMLRDGDRPFVLKQRIFSKNGHLSNEDAARLVCRVLSGNLRDVFLAHLSQECNRAALALAATERSLTAAGAVDISIRLTYPDRISDAVTYKTWEEERVPAVINTPSLQGIETYYV